MPKLNGAPVNKPGPRPVAPAAVTVAGEPPVARLVFAHAPEDHISFLNADGTRSRICICVCVACWPKDGRPCPDWNDEPEGV